MKPCVFIHTNHRQYIGALVSAYSMQRCSPNADKFDVRIIEHKDYPFFERHEGAGIPARRRQAPLAQRRPAVVHAAALHAARADGLRRAARWWSTPTCSRSATSTSCSRRDMGGKAIMCRTRSGTKRLNAGAYASSVMLLDCARLSHWQVEQQFEELFTFERDYRKWINLEYEPDGHHRPVRARVERLRPAEPRDQDGPQHQAHDPALEERPAGRLHPGRDLPAVPADRLADARAAQAVRRLRPARPATAATRTTSRRTCSSACCASAWPRASSARSCCARRCAATMSATTRSR